MRGLFQLVKEGLIRELGAEKCQVGRKRHTSDGVRAAVVIPGEGRIICVAYPVKETDSWPPERLARVLIEFMSDSIRECISRPSAEAQ